MPDDEIIEAMILQDEKDSIRAEMLQDELHERRMLTDFEYFLKHSEFEELEEMYRKIDKKAWEYGWLDVRVKDWL